MDDFHAHQPQKYFSNVAALDQGAPSLFLNLEYCCVEAQIPGRKSKGMETAGSSLSIEKLHGLEKDDFLAWRCQFVVLVL